MARYVAREFGIETTHLIDTVKVDAAVKFGAPYRRVDGRAVCDKDLVDGVVLPGRLQGQVPGLQKDRRDAVERESSARLSVIPSGGAFMTEAPTTNRPLRFR
jgi:hypothetical protein